MTRTPWLSGHAIITTPCVSISKQSNDHDTAAAGTIGLGIRSLPQHGQFAGSGHGRSSPHGQAGGPSSPSGESANAQQHAEPDPQPSVSAALDACTNGATTTPHTTRIAASQDRQSVPRVQTMCLIVALDKPGCHIFLTIHYANHPASRSGQSPSAGPNPSAGPPEALTGVCRRSCNAHQRAYNASLRPCARVD